MSEPHPAFLRLGAPFAAALTALVVWLPLRNNYFANDDFAHLYDLVTRSLPSLLGQFWGGHPLGLYNVVSSVMFWIFGPHPRNFFWVVLLTHVLNTALLYRLIHRFTASAALAFFGALLWGTCATLEGTLGWYSVYGQVLLTTIVLWVVSSLVGRLATGERVAASTALLWTTALALGSTASGMGLGVAAVFPLVAVLTLGREQLTRASGLVLLLGAAATLTTYEVSYQLLPDIERVDPSVLSLATVLHHLPTVLAFEAHLVAVGAAALLSDAFGVSWQQRPEWVRATATTVCGLLVGIGTLCARDRGRRRIAALALLVGAVYGMVAAGRAVFFEKAHVPAAAAAAASPRYQYLPLAFLVSLLCAALAELGAISGRATRVVKVGAALWSLAALAGLALFPVPIRHWDSERAETEALLQNIREQVAQTRPGEVAWIENRPFGISAVLPDLLPGWAGVFVVYFPNDTVDGRPVRFLVSERDWQNAQLRGGRIAELVVRH